MIDLLLLPVVLIVVLLVSDSLLGLLLEPSSEPVADASVSPA